MNIAGLDIATVSGLAYIGSDQDDNQTITATFRAKIKNEFLEAAGAGIDPEKEGDVARQFEDHLHAWLIINKIEYVAIESPMISNPTRTKTVVDTDKQFYGQSIRKETADAGNMKAIFRMWGLEMIACLVCKRLNIPVVMVAQGTWRKEFLGDGRPKDAKDRAARQCEKLGIKYSSKDSAEAAGVAIWLKRKLFPYKTRGAEDLFNKLETTPRA